MVVYNAVTARKRSISRRPPAITRLNKGASKRVVAIMAETIVPHFHNEPGLPVIEIGAREFMCVGAKPPFDHPHIFIDMGDDSEAVCPYCSTLYRFDSTLNPHSARPSQCALPQEFA